MLNMLSGLSLAKILGGAALVAILTLLVLWKAADRRADKWEAQSLKLSAQLERLADESEAKQRETAKRVEAAKERIVVVDRIAKGIEGAPLKGNCATPDAVMGADL